MSGFLLDTNYVSELVRAKPDPAAVAWMAAADESQLFLSVLTFGEIRKGIQDLDVSSSAKRARLEEWLRVDLPKRFAGRIIGVDQGIAERWGILASE